MQLSFLAFSLPLTSNLRAKTSGLWIYAADVDKEENLFRNGKGILVWHCAECAEGKCQEYILDGKNAHFKEHFWKVHGIMLIKSIGIIFRTSQM